jgi:hypothetical protein
MVSKRCRRPSKAFPQRKRRYFVRKSGEDGKRSIFVVLLCDARVRGKKVTSTSGQAPFLGFLLGERKTASLSVNTGQWRPCAGMIWLYGGMVPNHTLTCRHTNTFLFHFSMVMCYGTFDILWVSSPFAIMAIVARCNGCRVPRCQNYYWYGTTTPTTQKAIVKTIHLNHAWWRSLTFRNFKTSGARLDLACLGVLVRVSTSIDTTFSLFVSLLLLS